MFHLSQQEDYTGLIIIFQNFSKNGDFETFHWKEILLLPNGCDDTEFCPVQCEKVQQAEETAILCSVNQSFFSLGSHIWRDSGFLCMRTSIYSSYLGAWK